MAYKWITPLSTVSWGDEIIIYQHRSGDTHLFSAEVKEMLEFFMGKQTFSKEQILQHFNLFFDSTEEREGYVKSLLDVLLQKDLIDVNCDH